jgi:hypothetical protein
MNIDSLLYTFIKDSYFILFIYIEIEDICVTLLDLCLSNYTGNK